MLQFLLCWMLQVVGLVVLVVVQFWMVVFCVEVEDECLIVLFDFVVCYVVGLFGLDNECGYVMFVLVVIVVVLLVLLVQFFDVVMFEGGVVVLECFVSGLLSQFEMVWMVGVLLGMVILNSFGLLVVISVKLLCKGVEVLVFWGKDVVKFVVILFGKVFVCVGVVFCLVFCVLFIVDFVIVFQEGNMLCVVVDVVSVLILVLGVVVCIVVLFGLIGFVLMVIGLLFFVINFLFFLFKIEQQKVVE